MKQFCVLKIMLYTTFVKACKPPALSIISTVFLNDKKDVNAELYLTFLRALNSLPILFSRGSITNIFLLVL